MFYSIAKALSFLIFKLTGGIEIYGAERLPKKGPLIIVSNHQSLIDPFVLVTCIPMRIVFFAAAYLFKIPVVRQVLTWGWAIPVHGEKGDFGSFKKALEILGRGGVVGIFPEGGVSPDGNLRPLMPGWAYLAAKSGAKVLPVTIRGSRNVLPVGSFILRRGRITLNIGEVMTFSGQGKVSREEISLMNERLEKEFRLLIVAQFNGRIFDGASKSI